MARIDRRSLFLGVPAVLLARRGAAAVPTPDATAGPFYPAETPADHDNDLVRVEGAVRQAGGEVLHLRGTLLDRNDRPVPGAIVEIWQCDARGIYRHPGDRRRESRDSGFQGFGRARTDASGAFAFRTILPVPYPGRTPHIHMMVWRSGRPLLTTQYYRAGHPQNERDFLFRRLSPAERRSVEMTITPHSEQPGTWETRVTTMLGQSV